MNRYDEIVRLVKRLHAAEAASLKRAEARSALPPGSSRAKVTTANAMWARAAEQRDRCQRDLAEALRAFPELK